MIKQHRARFRSGIAELARLRRHCTALEAQVQEQTAHIRDLRQSHQVASPVEKEGSDELEVAPGDQDVQLSKIYTHDDRIKGGSDDCGQPPSWTFLSWLSSLTVLQPLAVELLKQKPSNQTEAEYAKQLNSQHVQAAFDRAAPAMRSGLCESHHKLRSQVDLDAVALNDKFSAAKDSFTFTYGGMDLYHGGLEALVGLPNPDIETAMLWEHTESWYAKEKFDCWYVSGGTSAKAEYECLLGKVTAHECENGLRHAGHDGLTTGDIMTRNGKNSVMITGTEYDGLTAVLINEDGTEIVEDVLKGALFSHKGTLSIEKKFKVKVHDDGYEGYFDGVNLKRNDVVQEAKLQKAEVMALRLYTGPMYIW